MSNKYFAIREKGTNNFLPALPKCRRGHSYQTPCDANHHIPRLFSNMWSARCALIAWLQGEFHTKRTGGSYFDDYDESTEVIHKPERKRENMEIVELEIHEIMAYPLRLKHE